MSLLKAYLQKPSTQRILSRKPGEKGFSLIELVVVVAVLAILAAIAIPNFTSINNKARASSASNTMATLVKECAVKHANACSGAACNYNAINLDGYTAVAAGTCPNGSGTLTFTSSDPTKWPSFTYNFATGAKTCANVSVENCSATGNW